jgi:hypothetical protein
MSLPLAGISFRTTSVSCSGFLNAGIRRFPDWPFVAANRQVNSLSAIARNTLENGLIYRSQAPVRLSHLDSIDRSGRQT